MPAGPQGAECGERFTQRLAITPVTTTASLSWEAVGVSGVCLGRLRMGGRGMLGRGVQAMMGPAGGLGEHRVIGFGPVFQLGEEALLPAVAHGDGQVTAEAGVLGA